MNQLYSSMSNQTRDSQIDNQSLVKLNVAPNILVEHYKQNVLKSTMSKLKFKDRNYGLDKLTDEQIAR